jgi:hypothetical protein
MDRDMTQEQFPVLNRWTKPVLTRKGSPRAKPEVRAKVAHTDAQKRRLEVFVTEPVMDALGWSSGGAVKAEFRSGHDGLELRLSPAHRGLRATHNSPKSKTVRVCIAGAPIRSGLCAPVQVVAFEIAGAALIVSLPASWSAPVLEAAQ